GLDHRGEPRRVRHDRDRRRLDRQACVEDEADPALQAAERRAVVALGRPGRRGVPVGRVRDELVVLLAVARRRGVGVRRQEGGRGGWDAGGGPGCPPPPPPPFPPPPPPPPESRSPRYAAVPAPISARPRRSTTSGEIRLRRRAGRARVRGAAGAMITVRSASG